MDSNFGRKVKCKTLLGNSITGTYVKKALAGWRDSFADLINNLEKSQME